MLDKISYELIKMQKDKLCNHFDFIQKLHDRYLMICNNEIDDNSNSIIIEEQIKFMENISIKVCPILDEINKYEESLASAAKLKEFIKIANNTRESCSRAKRDFLLVYKKVVSELNTIDILEEQPGNKFQKIQNLPTESLVQNILTAFNEVKESSRNLDDACKEAKMNETGISSYNEEYENT